MIGVILAAGVGSRLQPITHRKPKCLVNVAGRPIVWHQVEALKAAGVEQVILVAGYMAEAVEAYCRAHWPKFVRIVRNDDFDTTNNMYSLFLACSEIAGKEFVLCNGDVVFEPNVVRRVVEGPARSHVVIDRASYFEESMKVVVDEDGWVRDISKVIGSDAAYGTSLDLYRFDASTSTKLFEVIRTYIEVDGELRQWTEVALQKLVQREKCVGVLDVAGTRWVEIDNFDDLAAADRLFSGYEELLTRVRLLVVDLDGTLYVGDRGIPGVGDWARDVRKRGLRLLFVTNNSSQDKDHYVRKLRSFDIEVDAEDIAISTDAAIAYLKEHDCTRVFALGTRALQETLRRNGIEAQSREPEYVLVGYDRELTYEKLSHACLFILRGVPLLATHADIVCPTPEGPIPDAGSILALLHAATGAHPREVFGKPNPKLVEWYLAESGLDWQDVAIIGDRLYTDGEMARRCGAAFVAVMSGETTRDQVEESDSQPSVILSDVTQLR